MSVPISTTIDLLRHGEPEGGHRYRGSTDDPLSKTGWQQMRDATRSDTPWDQIVSSPLSRCAEFANELSDKLALPMVIEEDLRELHFGDWEGRESKELWASEREALMAFFTQPEKNPPPNGETLQAFRERLMTLWERLLVEYRGQHIVLVCHGGVIRLLLSQVLGQPLKYYARFDVPYACRSRLRVFHGDQGEFPILLSHTPLVEDE